MIEPFAFLHRTQRNLLIFDLTPQAIEIGGIAGDRRRLILPHRFIELPFRFHARGAIRLDPGCHRATRLIDLIAQPFELRSLRLIARLLGSELTLQLRGLALHLFTLCAFLRRLLLAEILRETCALQLDVGKQPRGLVESRHVVRTARHHLRDVGLVIRDISIRRRPACTREIRLGSLQIVVSNGLIGAC